MSSHSLARRAANAARGRPRTAHTASANSLFFETNLLGELQRHASSSRPGRHPRPPLQIFARASTDRASAYPEQRGEALDARNSTKHNQAFDRDLRHVAAHPCKSAGHCEWLNENAVVALRLGLKSPSLFRRSYCVDEKQKSGPFRGPGPRPGPGPRQPRARLPDAASHRRRARAGRGRPRRVPVPP